MKSALLEKRLLELTESGMHIDHPEYVRMICFLIKLEEKKNRNVDIFLLTFPERPQRAVLDEIKARLSVRDLCITFDERMAILTLSEREPESVREFDTFLASQKSLKTEWI